MRLNNIILATVAVVTVGLGLYVALNKDQKTYEKEFSEYLMKFGRVYGNRQERDFRYNIFVDNMKYMESKKNNSFQMGINQFSDIEWSEF